MPNLRRILLPILLLLAAAGGSAMAQPGGPISANPKARQLHHIWMVQGRVNRKDYVGEGACGLGDIFGTGYSAWAVFYGGLGEWRIYKGGKLPLDTTPVVTLHSWSIRQNHFGLGDFWGTGHKALVGVLVGYDTASNTYYTTFPIYRTDSNRIDSTPSVIVDPFTTKSRKIGIGDNTIIGADLDGDGADELIIATEATRRQGELSYNAEIWIYKGGANFQVDTPTVILRDPESNSGDYYSAVVGDFDGDHHLDILTSGEYSRQFRMKFWWGNGSLDWDSSGPDRTVVMADSSYPDLWRGVVALDCNGDHVPDILTGDEPAITLFQSGPGKNARTRSFAIDDADQVIRNYGRQRMSLGFMNDSARRYEMVGIVGPTVIPGGNAYTLLGFSGGPNGPDRSYDCYYEPDIEGIGGGAYTGFGGPVGDVDGDGWEDYITANPSYPSPNESWGIALVIAGGPEIPRDYTSNVREVTVDGKAAGLYLWPNPVRDHLHIAWRGDLRRMPHSFAVHTLLGQQVAWGELNPWQASAEIDLALLASGTYLVSIFDGNGNSLATAPVLKF